MVINKYAVCILLFFSWPINATYSRPFRRCIRSRNGRCRRRSGNHPTPLKPLVARREALTLVIRPQVRALAVLASGTGEPTAVVGVGPGLSAVAVNVDGGIRYSHDCVVDERRRRGVVANVGLEVGSYPVMSSPAAAAALSPEPSIAVVGDSGDIVGPKEGMLVS